MHPENSIVHVTRSMRVCSFICSGGVAVIVLILYNIFHAKSESEMLCIQKILRIPTVVKMNTGRWLPAGGCSAEIPLVGCRRVEKAVKTALLKLVPTVDVELIDDKVVVLRNTRTKAMNEDDDDTGTKILIAPVIPGRGVPATFATRPYVAVCSVPCRLCSQ